MSNTYIENNNSINSKKMISMGASMENKKYDTVKIKRNGMQISLEFPPKSARDQLIEQEVKESFQEN